MALEHTAHQEAEEAETEEDDEVRHGFKGSGADRCCLARKAPKGKRLPGRVMAAMLKMVKIDVAALERAYVGRDGAIKSAAE
jgi:hypothetical protein